MNLHKDRCEVSFTLQYRMWGERGPCPPPGPVKIIHKKMVAECGHIDFMFMFLPPLLTRPLDPLLLWFPFQNLCVNEKPDVRFQHNFYFMFILFNFYWFFLQYILSLIGIKYYIKSDTYITHQFVFFNLSNSLKLKFLHFRFHLISCVWSNNLFNFFYCLAKRLQAYALCFWFRESLTFLGEDIF